MRDVAFVWRAVAARADSRVPAARRAFIQQQNIRVQVVRQRYGEKQQDKRRDHRGPFPHSVSRLAAVLVHPLQLPDGQAGRGNQHPQNVEKSFHLANSTGRAEIFRRLHASFLMVHCFNLLRAVACGNPSLAKDFRAITSTLRFANPSELLSPLR